MQFTRSDFPEGFQFGVATSAYQIEGHAFGGAGATHWDSFAATPGNVVRAENGARGCDHYHLYEQDLDLVADASFDCYRFSTSWARVLPEGRGPVNQAGLDFYDRLTDAMLERGIKPCATLYHWELPSPLADLGGWRNRDIAGWFADFTQIIMGRIGDRMHSVAPINEPWCVSWLSHFLGQHAPGLRDIRATARAMHHVLLSHGRAIEVMRGLGMSNLGAVFNMPVELMQTRDRAGRETLCLNVCVGSDQTVYVTQSPPYHRYPVLDPSSQKRVQKNCVACGAPSKQMVRFDGRGAPHGEEDHDHVWDYKVISQCTECHKGTLESHSHDCWSPETEPPNLYWLGSLSPEDMAFIRSQVWDCPNPMNSECQCDTHRWLKRAFKTWESLVSAATRASHLTHYTPYGLAGERLSALRVVALKELGMQPLPSAN